jgi:hypothetical protein
MKSFKEHIQNPLSAGQLLIMIQDEKRYSVLCVRSELPVGAIILITDPNHKDYGNLVNTKSLQDTRFVIHQDLQSRLPITTYLFQTTNSKPIKRIEYHDVEEGVEEMNLSEDLERAALLYFQGKYRTLKRKDKVNEKLELIIEMLLSEYDEYRVRFVA